MAPLEHVKSNILTNVEKSYKLQLLRKGVEEVGAGEVDGEFISYLYQINEFPSIIATQCCCGHGEDPESRGRRIQFDLRSTLTVEDTLNLILRPFDVSTSVTIYSVLESDRFRYFLWLGNSRWADDVFTFINILSYAKGPLLKW